MNYGPGESEAGQMLGIDRGLDLRLELRFDELFAIDLHDATDQLREHGIVFDGLDRPGGKR